MNDSLKPLLLAAMLVCQQGTAFAQRNLTDIPDPDPEIERKSFIVADGFEVNLFAADPQIAKPIQMNFDPEGRLWIASSEIYPHIKPGEKANDRILVVEDADGDGVADKTSVFADGLLIPTAVVPGDGGAYVGNSTELLHFKDTDGDGKADEERVVLSGFGTEDTHHILHTLRWGPEGLLYFNQSIYIHSHIETPWGVKRLNAGGIWQFRPESMELDVFARGWVNTWGHHFDAFGQSFATDGAGGEGINYAIPGAAYPTAQGVPRIFHGLNPGSPKYCGIEVVSGRHLPDDWQGNVLTNDFRGNRVCRFVLSEDGAGYAAREQVEVIRTKHVAFRPIDIKMGPDGAIYIADWYNPIIQHGEVDFRDERRDHVHGRIWRVTYKGNKPLQRPMLRDASVEKLLTRLADPEMWTRENTKRVLKERGRDAVLPVLNQWVAQIDADNEALRLEALWVYQALDEPNADLLRALLNAKDGRVRAAAVRVLKHWRTRVPDAGKWLTLLAQDEHPRVRLEAVRVLADVRSPEAIDAALAALHQPVDRFLDYALWLTAWESRDAWLPLVEQGKFDFGGDATKATFALMAVGSPSVVPRLVELLKTDELVGERWNAAVDFVVARGNANQFAELLTVAASESDQAQRNALLRSLVAQSRTRKVVPQGDLKALDGLLADGQPEPVRAAAAEAAGVWKVARHSQRLESLARSGDEALAVRAAAINGLAALRGREAVSALTQLSGKDQPFAVRESAVLGLAAIDVNVGTQSLVATLQSSGSGDDPSRVIATLLGRKGGPGAIARALKGQKLPGDVAKLAIRVIDSSGRKLEDLKLAFSAAGDIQSGATKLTPEEMATLVAEVAKNGDPTRGEAIYRRKDLSCLKCHAVGGAGGRVGPDLASIGGSAPVDYIVQSLLDPGAKVKEGYHTVIVITEDGKTASGIKVRQTDTELILRDAEDRETAIALASIEEQVDGASLMPAGLTERLTRAEIVDLVAFLSRLGKVGGITVGRERVVRRWEVLLPTNDARFRMRRTRLGSVTQDDPAYQWSAAYSRVNGELPLQEQPQIPFKGPFQQQASGLVIARFDLDVGTAGEVELALNDPEGVTAWLGTAPVEPSGRMRLTVEPGRHRVTLAVSLANRTVPLRAVLQDVDGSSAQVQVVGGK
ncbi:MAG: PVC-type heme-binding CxxCH protein [Planctomycetota bacterium]|jgi:putative heme-binding domain-containing protein